MTLTHRDELLALAGILVLTGLLFTPVLSAPFLYDDQILILSQSHLHTLSRWPEWFTEPYFPAMLGQGAYRPLTSASFAITWVIAGASPLAFHLTNWALHLIATFLVWWCAVRIGLSPIARLIAALLFAVHPVHVEVIAGIAFRTDSLLYIFSLGALGAYLGRSATLITWKQCFAVVLCLVFALGTKESGLLLPLLLAAAEITLQPVRWSDRASRTRLLTTACTAAVIIATFVFLKIRVNGQFGVLPEQTVYPGTGLTDRLPLIPITIWHHARLLLWPMHLSADHVLTWPPLGSAAATGLLASLVCVATLYLITLIWVWRRFPRVAFCLLWIPLSLATYLHLAPIGVFIAERFEYVASAVVCWLAGAVWDAVRPRWKAPLLVVCVLISSLFAVRSLAQTLVWRDPVRFYAATAEATPASFRAWQGLGHARLDAGSPHDAALAFERALALRPDSALVRLGWARAELALQRPAAAERLLEEALAIQPQNSDIPRLWYNLAVVKLASHDPAGASLALDRAVALGYRDTRRVELLKAEIAGARP